MTARRSIANHSAQLLTIRGTRVAVQLAIMAVTARQYGPGPAGQFALALAITAPIFVVADLGLRTLYLSRAPRPPFGYLLRLRFATLALALVACAAIALLRPDLGLVIAAVSMIKVSDSLIDTSIGPIQLHDRLWWATATTLTGTLATLVLFVALGDLGFERSLLVATAIGVLLLGTASVATGVTAARSVESTGEPHRVTSGLVRDGVAVGVSIGILSLATSVPQYVLAAVYSTAVSGRYAVMIYLVVAGEMLMNAAGQAVLPHLVRHRDTSGMAALSETANRYLLRGTLAAVPAAVLAVAMGAFAIPAIMGPTYRFTWSESAVLVVMLVMLPALFIGAVVLQTMNLYRATATISVSALALVTVSALFLVPRLGVTGALLSAAAGTALRIVLAQRRWRRVGAVADPSTREVLTWSS